MCYSLAFYGTTSEKRGNIDNTNHGRFRMGFLPQKTVPTPYSVSIPSADTFHLVALSPPNKIPSGSDD